MTLLADLQRNEIRSLNDACPVDKSERISALDTLRGFALLGILLMNIVAFAMYHQAYDNPTSAGGATGINLGIWYVLHVLAEGKMRCLFSLIFGASAILLTSRLEGRPDAADIYYRRTLWLLVFGIAHSFLLWQGEILYPYAMCGFALYPFRKMSVRGLAVLSMAMILYCAVFYGLETRKNQEKIISGKAAVSKAEKGEKLTEEETDARDEWVKLKKDRNPSSESLAKDAAEWRGNPWRVIKARAELVMRWNSIPYYHPWSIDVLSMMLLGMALMKNGILAATRSAGFYARLALIGYGIGLPLHAINGWLTIKSNFDPVTQGYSGTVYDIGRLAVAAGHLGALLFLCRRGWLKGLTDRLGAVGQMALTNYVTHSVVCAFLFTGYGFALYGKLQRYEIYFVVVGLWLFQLIVSPIWLRRFRFGPLEWCWRSLTYWRRQPMLLD